MATTRDLENLAQWIEEEVEKMEQGHLFQVRRWKEVLGEVHKLTRASATPGLRQVRRASSSRRGSMADLLTKVFLDREGRDLSPSEAATALLLDHQLAASRDSVNSVLHHRKRVFERVAPGRYRLRSAATKDSKTKLEEIPTEPVPEMEFDETPWEPITKDSKVVY